MDFNSKSYINLINKIIENGYAVVTFLEYLQTPFDKNLVILRHDVDRTPKNALKMAELEHELGIKATYFFRSRSHVLKNEIIQKIESLGHEIGYHYENLSDTKGDFEKAIHSFSETLSKFRQIAKIKTICMHGSPLSKINNQELWKKYNFKDFDIIGEPYFSIDFNKVAYITDAGRKWNDEKVNFRDKVKSTQNYNIKDLNEIINIFLSEDAPECMMINIHPHNWAFSGIEWLKIFIWQSLKNIIKTLIHYFDKRN